jgi:hypothetical protein
VVLVRPKLREMPAAVARAIKLICSIRHLL